MSVENLIQEVNERTGREPDGKRIQHRQVGWSAAKIFVTKAPSESVQEIPSNADLVPFAGCLMVGVKKSDHRDFPLYRVDIGTITNDGRFLPGISPHADIVSLRAGEAVWDGAMSATMSLLSAAKLWIEDDTNEAIAWFQARGGNKVFGNNGEATKTKQTGKTDRNRARGKAQPKRG